MNNHKELLRQQTHQASNTAKLWFEETASTIDRFQFGRKGGLNDTGQGAVYMYCDELGEVIYVGQTGRRIKARLYDQTSPHAKKDWWSKWTVVKFVQMPKAMDRLALEFLLILAHSPKENLSPAAVSFEELFN